MKARYIKEVNDIKITVEVEFDKFTDDVADALAFLDFPQRVVNEVSDPRAECKDDGIDNTLPDTAMDFIKKRAEENAKDWRTLKASCMGE